MNMYIFQYIDQASQNYHSGGGLMVIAKDKAHVEELIKEDVYIEISKEEWQSVMTYALKDEHEPKVMIFPDAGCC